MWFGVAPAYAIYNAILNEYTHEKPTKAHHFIKMLLHRLTEDAARVGHRQSVPHEQAPVSIDLLDRECGFSIELQRRSQVVVIVVSLRLTTTT